MSVAIHPGQTAFTRMPAPRSSAASTRVRAFSAAVSLVHRLEAAIDAGVVGDVEPNELSAELVRGQTPSLVVARRHDRSEAVLDQLPHDLATDASICAGNKRDSAVIGHRLSRSHPPRLRPGGCPGRPGLDPIRVLGAPENTSLPLRPAIELVVPPRSFVVPMPICGPIRRTGATGLEPASVTASS